MDKAYKRRAKAYKDLWKRIDKYRKEKGKRLDKMLEI